VPQQPQQVDAHSTTFDPCRKSPHPGVAQELVVLRRDHPAGDDLDVGPPGLAQRATSSGISVLCPAASELAPTASTLSASASARLPRGLEQRARDHLEAHVGERAGDHVGAAVVPVLAHLGDQQPRRAAEPAADRLHAATTWA
jgi:hypothetical protein